jgi:glycerophosphoryl diester phosphodiesterase
MVDTHAIRSPKINVTIEEQALVAKTGNPEDNEDLIHLSPFFVAVIDGSTSKTTRLWDGKTGGQVCAQIIDRVLSQLPGNATSRETVDTITARIKDFYETQGVLELVQEDPSQRATAALVVASLQRKEIWFVGDCQCMLDDRLLQNTKPIDAITAGARAMFLETELQKGTTIEELRQSDTGREFILPLLKQQQFFQNKPAAGAYWYPIIDGFSVPDEGIRVEPIPETIQTIILASDGYPILKSSLEASEQELQRILECDPLLFRSYKATKGVQEGNISYDDRAYIKLRLSDEQRKDVPAPVRGSRFNKPAKKRQKKKKLNKRSR